MFPMRIIGRAFGITLGCFLLGTAAGVLAVFVLPGFRDLVLGLIQARVLAPIRAVSAFGRLAVILLVFANNSIPVMLSFLYPFLITKVRWTPPLTFRQRRYLLTAFTAITSFMIGFFSLGAALAVEWLSAGANGVLFLLSSASVHGPLEFALVLVCVAEPLRLAGFADDSTSMRMLRDDLKLLLFSILGLFVSASIEVALGL